MEEKVRISMLLSLYGNLLTETQKKYMEMYYNEDYSLSEIGEIENNITRQAVRTILVKSKNKLNEYEEKLRFLEKETKLKEILLKTNKDNIEENKNKLEEMLDI